MKRSRLTLLFLVCFFSLISFSQNIKGTLSGRVTDNVGAVLQGAQIRLEPNVGSIVSDKQGGFIVSDLTAGAYTVTISFVGFSPLIQKVTVTSGQVTRLDAVMQVASDKEQVVVTAMGEHGDAEAINRMRTSPNILNVLTDDQIMSLPNVNVADALGRLPGVTLERDEGEGKYVQIRGTEPRLSNTTIDGVNVPSPESGVRQVKLDTIPSDIVESVEVNKTLSANQDGDAIGGSVNLVTKTAGEEPTVSMFGSGGYTPIIGGRHVSQYGITAGKRFLGSKRLGLLAGFTYDYNGRGIDDIEPSPTTDSLTPHYDSNDLREYRYDRSRWGVAGGADYKLSEGSGLYARFFYSDFKDYGDKWVYTLQDTVNNGNLPSFSTSKRLPDYAIANLVLGGKHLFTNSWLSYEASVSRARQAAAAGDPGADFSLGGTAADFAMTGCYYNPSANQSKYRPQWSPGCGDSASSPIYDPTQWSLADYSTTQGQTTQLNLQGAAAYALNYHAGSHFSTFEFGFKIRNGHKGQFAFSPTYNGDGSVSMTNFLENFHNSNYYDKSYVYGPVVDYDKIVAFGKSNAGLFTVDEGQTHLNSDASNFNLDERITAGYLMNTIEFGKFRLQTGLRFEATNLKTTGYQVTNDADGNYISTTPVNETGSYLDPLPSIQLRYSITPNAAIRAVYGRGISRPDPQDIIASVTLDQSTNPYTYQLGNPNLRAEHANNYDLLYEQYLNPLGLIQAGFFYKQLGDPIISITNFPTSGPYAGFKVTQPTNAGSAWVTGLELSYQQHLSYFPGLLSGFGFFGNYTYTASQATGVDPLRSDKPRLLRQAPNAWNIGPSYDYGHISVRTSLEYNGASIYQYQYENLNSDGTPNPQVGGVPGPAGDNYIYTHLQLDAQATYRLPAGFSIYASGLNLTNEVFGFYNGSPQYVVQREYYKPTYSGGIRWTSAHEK